ncbi:MAG: polysaccharide biosynthesis protein [Flavobacteriales bacterium]|nr:polysaccharide biosynthesis protein [Flavobacteriales bacterium]MCX7767702.1 polysaccharide biosynthesis protein [Flavobacteriales bacterium]MDW8409403.1 nucleoside-diphosphate sugar epimerase/dehydratase [Flavobacteriales bacterium]
MKRLTLSFGNSLKKFLTKKYTSRLTVLWADILLSGFSYFVCYFLFWQFLRRGSLTDQLPALLGLTVIVKALFFYFFKTYNGVVRFAGEKDAFRILLANFSAMLLLILLNLTLLKSILGFKAPNTVYLFDFLASTFVLIGYRIFIRLILDFTEAGFGLKVPTVIFGAGQAGYITKRAIDKDPQTRYRIVAFLDDNPGLHNKRLDGVPICAARNCLEKLVKSHNVRQVIISIQSLSDKRKKEFIEQCLSLNLKVLQVPPVRTWINSELNVHRLKDVRLEDLLGRDPIHIDTKAISDQLHRKRVLITGAAGSIGSELARQVAGFEPAELLLVDNAETPLVEFHLELQEQHKITYAKALVADITDECRMDYIFRRYRPEIVFHAAAYKHVPIMELNPREAVRVNVFGTKILADLSVTHGVKKFVMISTDKAVNPTNVMGASKRVAEIYTQALDRCHTAVSGGTRFVTTRFGNVLGSNGSVIPRFKKQIESGGPVTVTHPEVTRYFMTIQEACRLVLEAGVTGNGGEIFLFDMGERIRILDLAEKMIRLAGKRPYEDIEIVFTGLRPGEKLTEELLNDSEKTIPTHHEKILKAKVAEFELEFVEAKLKELQKCFALHDELGMVAVMKELVPEYISNNSKFSVLDKVSVDSDLSGEGV